MYNSIKEMSLIPSICIDKSLAFEQYVIEYNIYLSPIANFPVPKPTGLTVLYERCFDLVKSRGGQLRIEVKRMHDNHGPIVRMNPSELHIDDPDILQRSLSHLEYILEIY